MADPNTTPQERVRIFDKQGFPVAEFRAAVERSWSLADEGRAAFTYPTRKTDVVNENVLRFGNWLLVENDYLPPWVGVIDTPRDFSPRVVAVHAYTPEHVFGWRRGPLEVKINGAAGAIFERLIALVNAPDPTVIRAGDIFRGGIAREETINPTPLSEDLSRIVERSGEEYHWRPVTDANGRLVVYADWMSVVGSRTSALLHEGKGGGNVEAVGNILVEDGEIFNDLLAYGDGQSWVSRPNAVVTDAASIAKYGVRQSAEEFSGVTNVNTLRENAAEKIAQQKEPVRSFHLNALHVGDTFKYLQLGNVLSLRFENMGFTGGGLGYETNVRITAMAYNPVTEKNKVELIVEEV